MSGKDQMPLLHGELSVIDAFRIIARDCLQAFSAHAQQFGDVEGVEALHQCRVAVRKMRSAFSLFKPVLDPTAVVRFNAEWRWIAGQLADARNLDVMLAEHFDGDVGRTGPLLDRILLAREAAYGQAIAAVTSRRTQRLVAEMTAWLSRNISSGRWNMQRIGPFVAWSLRKNWRRTIKRQSLPIKRLPASDLHRLRIRVKRLRYAVGFFAPLFDGDQAKSAETFRQRLAEMQDSLGALNDMPMARSMIFSLGLAPSERDEAEWILSERADVRKKLLKHSQKLHRKLAETKPFWRKID